MKISVSFDERRLDTARLANRLRPAIERLLAGGDETRRRHVERGTGRDGDEANG